MLVSLLFGVALAREVTIVVVDGQDRPLPGRLRTSCGCSALTDVDTGVWRGDEIPGGNGSVSLVRGAVLELDVSAVGYQTTHVVFRIGWRPRFVVELRPLPLIDLVGELDYWDCGWTWHAYDSRDGGTEDTVTSAFTPPPPPPSPPPAGWDCRKAR